MYRGNKCAHCLGRGMLTDAMSEVEHMAWVRSIGLDNALYFRLDHGRRCEQHRRIEIALQGDPVTHALAGTS